MNVLRKFMRHPAAFNSILSIQHITVRNAGHSKWANIKHTKMEKDTLKSMARKRFSNLIRTAIKAGGSFDPKLNKQLADVIEIAKQNFVPNENIQKILKLAKDGSLERTIEFSVRGPSGSYLILQVLTDNPTRSKQEITSIVKKKNCILSEVSQAARQFKLTGVILCSEYDGRPISEESYEVALNHAIEAGAEDVCLKDSGDEDRLVLEFTTDPSPSHFYPVSKELEKLNYKVIYSNIDYIPSNLASLSEPEAELLSSLCEKLSLHPEVDRIYDNAL